MHLGKHRLQGGRGRSVAGDAGDLAAGEDLPHDQDPVRGLSHEEVAEAMDVSPRTVNNHLVKALRTIRDRVRAYEPTLLD